MWKPFADLSDQEKLLLFGTPTPSKMQKERYNLTQYAIKKMETHFPTPASCPHRKGVDN